MIIMAIIAGRRAPPPSAFPLPPSAYISAFVPALPLLRLIPSSHTLHPSPSTQAPPPPSPQCHRHRSPSQQLLRYARALSKLRLGVRNLPDTPIAPSHTSTLQNRSPEQPVCRAPWPAPFRSPHCPPNPPIAFPTPSSPRVHY
jgi:hypothetical protein